ncbi:aminoglycoside phosphotransferase family protein [Microlunatus ginsengisoli]|uniref:Aminoglycoside phosphotransferase domain-containing protein n=1 Tax=Microlunatus ginsengisoli TaxID=363863 RepID=A0ABP7AA37_9ACTN
MGMEDDPAGWALLTSPGIGELLAAAVAHGGGTLRSWRVDGVDAEPGLQTTATYQTEVEWPFGPRTELLGVSARVGGAAGTDADAVIFAAGDRQVAAWLYPRDPDLPGLVRAALPGGVAQLLTENLVLGRPVDPAQVHLELVGYRPRRRAVLRAVVADADGPRTFFLKVLKDDAVAPTVRRHELLRGAGLPVPEVVAATDDQVLILPALPGRTLAHALFDGSEPCSGEVLVGLLDALPAEAAELPRHIPWADAVGQYAHTVAQALPGLQPRLTALQDQIAAGLDPIPPGGEATHGDFHEGQVFVDGGRVVGLLDVDRVGPGRRADDLACLVAHLATIQGMTPEQERGIDRLAAQWMTVFDARVDPAELRLRAAAIVISLATGPYRTQQAGWQQATEAIIVRAEQLLLSIR